MSNGSIITFITLFHPLFGTLNTNNLSNGIHVTVFSQELSYVSLKKLTKSMFVSKPLRNSVKIIR